MGITSFYNKSIDTERMTNVGGGSKRQDWQANLSGIPCQIMPESGELSQVQGSAFYNRFKMWCSPTADIEIGDRVTDNDGVVYSITGKSLFDGLRGSGNKHAKYNLLKGK